VSNRSFIVVMAAIGVIALLAFGLFAKDPADIALGEPAPDAAVERLGGGEPVSLSDLRGRWVLVNFWASWCAPCKSESPDIEAYRRAHPGLEVVGVNVKDATTDAQQFIRETDIHWTQLHDGDGERQDAYGIVALPESFLVDPDGNLALIRRGVVDRSYLEENVTPLIEEAP
jgi:thiol-disulfide isomerase/thioredoxin